MNIFSRWFQISKFNLKYNFFPNFLLGFVLILITPAIFGIGNLNASAAWTPLEMLVSLVGVILLVPVFLPEQDNEIADVVGTKATNPILVYLIRIVYSFVGTVLLIILFCVVMILAKSETSLLHIAGTTANAMFLGSLGLLAFSVSKNVAISYMVPLIYYAINFSGGETLGNFYLFSAMNGSYHEKIYLFIGGILLILLALGVKWISEKFK